MLLAAAFLAHGALLLAPPPDIAALMVEQLPHGFWLVLGVAEVAAAIGITLPGIARVMPRLVPAAAAGIVIVMVGATIWHLMRAEWSSSVITLVLLLMAACVAYMRWSVVPIQPRRAEGPGHQGAAAKLS